MNLQQSTLPSLGQTRSIPWPWLFGLGMWGWAIWSCAEHWEANPNYSYGWAVPLLGAGFALRQYWRLPKAAVESAPHQHFGPAFQIIFGAVIAAVVFALEYWREQMWHPVIVLWSICLLVVLSTLGLFRFYGGYQLARTELFPVLFLLTAVPWPPRFEQPITLALMKWVASATTELLHWFGIEAQTSGGAIALSSGLVGITEACSGVRSMQAGIMFGLAMGEWFLLRPLRRVALLAVALFLAMGTNLIRTLILSFQAHRHGLQSLDQVHDLIGNVMITALIVAIWIAGKLLASGERPMSGESIKERLRSLRLMGPAAPVFRTLSCGFLIGIISARVVTARIEAQDQTQKTPFFASKADNSNQRRLLSRDIVNELHPTTAEYIHRGDAGLPRGEADCFHFFWKPSPWNRFLLVHRPDICMPGIGWAQTASPKAVDVQLSGQSVRCQLFRFQRGNVYALELWGVWRNGEPVSIDYEAAQVLGAVPAPPSLHFEGKRHSATEIVACTVIADNAAPADDTAVTLLQAVFQYKRQ